MTDQPRVVAALSGGVDSSVAAALMVERGHQVIGATLKLWSCEDPDERGACCNAEAVTQARAVADILGIPHYIIECEDPFAAAVLQPAWSDYRSGRTPNPCVLCNTRIKFGQLLDGALGLGSSQVATGHYARVEHGPDGLALLRGVDPGKDQSYFLCGLTPHQLEAASFPLGGMDKPAVRDIARRYGFPNADRSESQDACLATEQGSFADALGKRFGELPPPGDIVDGQGNVLGRHEGVHRFTIGQRRGLGIAVGRPAFVIQIDAPNARVTISTDSQDLFSSQMTASGMNWLAPPPRIPTDVLVQIRYRSDPVPATVHALDDGSVDVQFHRPVRAISPGQAAVIYQGEQVLGGGWID